MPPKAAPKKPVAAKGGVKGGASNAGAKKTVAVKKPEEKKAEEKPKPPKVEPTTISMKEIAKFVADEDKTIHNCAAWPLMIDVNEVAARFLQYQNINLIQGLQENMNPETIRKALIGAIRYGKPFAFDMLDFDLYEVFKVTFEGIMPGLLDMLLDKSILKEENYLKLVKDSDGEEYSKNNFSDFYMDNFMFLVVTSNPKQNNEFTDRMWTVTVQ